MTKKPVRRSERPEVDRTGCTLLHHAAAHGDEQEAARLLHAGTNVNARDEDGWSPLHFAAQSKAAAVARLLIEAGAEIDATDLHGNTPLWTAVFTSKGEGALIELLRKAGANPLQPNSHNVSPLQLARHIANYDVAQFFADLP